MPRIVTLLVGGGRDGDRPWLATLTFWAGIVASWTARVPPMGDHPLLLPEWLLLVVTVVMVLVWTRLGWTARRDRHVWAVVFATGAIGFGIADGSGNSAFVLVVALANVTMVAGTATGVASAAGLVATVFVAVPLVFDKSWSDSGDQALGLSGFAVATIAVAQVLGSERRSAVTAQRLLGEVESAHAELVASHAELESAHAALRHHSEQEQELAVANERARLAREVHDAVGHHLTVAQLNLTYAQRLRAIDEETAWAEVADARSTVATALREVRRAVRAMGPAPLVERTLCTALSRLSRTFDGTGLEVTFAVEGPARALPAHVDLTLYRVAEEALTNAARHAQEATRADVLLTYEPDRVTLSVHDDGRLDSPITPGFGLDGARRRLLEVGGVLEVSRAEHDGLLLTARVPADVVS
ncbi:sensor histidine kinase [Actinomyces howellii]|uniref:histidine kinase n=1 Tax=Actinomyces howellii TaxID=52771 RepID=A0A448HKA9_9ACTO|nr:sensor histidine kinase [Actinomyces howellii]VEG30145.1 Sensor histidine kinase desK [Actinomyces howellii]